MQITYSANMLVIGDIQRSFENDIRAIEALPDKVLVLLSIPMDDKTTIDNIYAVTFKGEIIWRSESLRCVYPKELHLPYEYMTIDNNLVQATDFYGRRQCLDIDTGRIVRRDIVK